VAGGGGGGVVGVGVGVAAEQQQRSLLGQLIGPRFVSPLRQKLALSTDQDRQVPEE